MDCVVIQLCVRAFHLSSSYNTRLQNVYTRTRHICIHKGIFVIEVLSDIAHSTCVQIKKNVLIHRKVSICIDKFLNCADALSSFVY